LFLDEVKKDELPIELPGGIFGGILFANRLCNTHGVASGECQLACDCEGAVDAVTVILNGTMVKSNQASIEHFTLLNGP